MQEHPAYDLTAERFSVLFDAVRSWGTWGRDDEQGALHLLTPERVAAATASVREGTTVTRSLPLNTHSGIHCPKPADHHMTALGGSDSELPGPLHFIEDYVGLDYHNDGHTHIDALCYVAFKACCTTASQKAW
jgi:hypothetical protein